jgi:hypothetical protein
MAISTIGTYLLDGGLTTGVPTFTAPLVAIKDIPFERRKHTSERVDSFIEGQVVFCAEIFEVVYQIGLLTHFLTLAFVPLLS